MGSPSVSPVWNLTAVSSTIPDIHRGHEEEDLRNLDEEIAVSADNTGEQVYLVGWDPNDAENPRNWTKAYKSWLTIQLAMLAFAASLGSSIISPAGYSISASLSTSQEVTVLTISFYVLGFAFGPSLWAPISETWGRRVSLLPAMFCLGLFSIGTATSKNAATVFITRFFGGLFGSSPVSNVSAALGDIWNPKARGTAVAFFAVAIVGGAMLGPIFGAVIEVNPHLGWRWTEYVEAILVFAIVALNSICLPELYAPVLLTRKAFRLRKLTGNNGFYHSHENIKLDFKSIFTQHLARPLRMLFTEPMIFCIALYASFVYALLYLTLEVFPIVFEQNRGYGLVISTLPFLGSFVGLLCAVLLNLVNQPRYTSIVDSNKGKPVPEARLMPMVAGGILLVVGLFWFGWTAAPPNNMMLPVVAAGFVGGGSNVITQQCINYLIDSYELHAASAVSANTILRSILAASFPLVVRPMFNTLGVGVAMSVLGGIACLALPVPFVLLKYGLRLRRRSKFHALDS